MYLRLAWRNIWRNKKRTIITISSIFFALNLAVFMRSMQLGSYDNMIKNSVKLYTGYLQIQDKKFWDEKTINNSFVYSEKIKKQITAIKDITYAVPRLESFALISSGKITKGVAVFGIDRKIENNMTGIKKRIVKGKYFTGNTPTVLISKQLAEFLNVNINDEIILYGQGYHGTTAAGKYTVTGIYNNYSTNLNKQIIYIPLQQAQFLYVCPGRITSLALMLTDKKKLSGVKDELKNKLSGSYNILTWQEMSRQLLQSIEVDNAGGIIMLGILYLVITFGIFGTVIMMVLERRKEFGILIAIGMKKAKLIMIIIFETLFIGSLGIIVGLAGAIPLILYMHAHPIQLTGQMADYATNYNMEPVMPFLLQPDLFYNQAITVFIISILTIVVPALYIKKLKVCNSIRGY